MPRPRACAAANVDRRSEDGREKRVMEDRIWGGFAMRSRVVDWKRDIVDDAADLVELVRSYETSQGTEPSPAEPLASVAGTCE